MNEEEIIDYLKEIIQEIEYRHKDGELILVNDITTDKLYYSIKGLLDLYNNEKEKNKSVVYNYECVVDKLEELEQIEKNYKEENGRLREKIKELEKEKEEEFKRGFLTKVNESYKHTIKIESQVIPKMKVREKIEELEKEKSKYTGYKGLEFSRTGLINAQKLVLQELLEERK